MAIIQNLVAMFRADSSAFEAGTKRARKSLYDLQAESNKTQKAFLNIAKGAAAFLGIGSAIYVAKRALISIKESTLEQESAEKQLQAALGTSIERYKNYAAQIQKVTIYGDEQIISQMAYAKNLGVTADRLEEATTAAIGLAAKYRLDLQTAFMLVGRASQGQTQMLTRYGIVLDESLSAQEKFNAILKIGAENFYLAEEAAKETAGAISQLKNSWSDLEEQIGQRYIPTAISAIRVTKQLIEAMNDLQKMENQATYLGGLKKGLTLPSRPDILQLINAYNEIQKIIDKANEFKGGAGGGFGGKGITGGWEETLPGTDGAAALTKEQMTAIVKSTREAMESVRHQDYLTRMERIESLKIYAEQNAETLSQVEEANKLLNDEIQSLERSRLDAMKVYAAELREDMQNQGLYISERFADTARSIEGSMSSAFESMIADGASFRDAMSQFFADMGRAFAKMAADMAARAIMAKLFGSFLGGFNFTGGGEELPAFGGMGGGVNVQTPHRGGVIGQDYFPRRTVPAAVFTEAPRLHQGLRSDEVPAILQKGERVIPKDRAIQGGGVYIENLTIKAWDTQDVKRGLYKERNFLSDLSLMSKKGNHANRRYEK